MTDTASSTAGGFEGHDRAQAWRHRCGAMAKKPWSLVEVGAVIGGFVVFWPLGLLALFLKLKRGEIWNGASSMGPNQATWQSWQDWCGNAQSFTAPWKRGPWSSASAPTGNRAFDEYRKVAFEKLEAERRKLEEEAREFDSFLEKLRKAKDEEDFQRFMAERNASKPE
jgi:hypothetical protein